MKKPVLFTAIVLLLVFDAATQEEIVVNRMQYIYRLKQVVDKTAWSGFAHKGFDLPLVYYTDSNCYVANPTAKFLEMYQPLLVATSPDLVIYKTIRLDDLPFHMETDMTFGKNSSAYNHRSPFMNCSSPEATKKAIPEVNTAELWATMVIHEYFHGFQFKHPAHLLFFEQNIAVSADTLKKFYDAQPWFKQGIDRENEMLLAAIAAKDENQIRNKIDSFFLLRQQRRKQMKEKSADQLMEIEKAYETMEGTARYVEYSLYRFFARKNADINLQKTDTAYRAYQYFRDFSLMNEPWLYQSEKTTYFYATGFNLARLLDRLKISYKTRLFKEAGLSLEQILSGYRKNRKVKTSTN